MFSARDTLPAILVTLLSINSVHAQVYWCTDENGKKTASDSGCKPGEQKREVNQKASVLEYTRDELSSKEGNPAPGKSGASNDPKCRELLDDISNTKVGDIGSKTFTEIATIKTKRNELTREYELRCLSAGDRQASQENRSNAQVQKQLNQLQQTQRQMQQQQMQKQHDQNTPKEMTCSPDGLGHLKCRDRGW